MPTPNLPPGFSFGGPGATFQGGGVSAGATGSGADSGYPSYNYSPDDAALWAQAQGMVSPFLDALTRQRQADEASAKAVMEARSQAMGDVYRGAVAPTQIAYAGAEQRTATTDEAVANRLAAQGGQAGESLVAKLAQIGAGDTNVAADIKNQYAGLGGAGFAGNATDLQRLIDRQSEQEASLARAPAEARAQSEQAMNEALNQIRSDFTGNYQDVLSQIPSYYSDISGRAENRARTAYEDKVNAYNEATRIKENTATAATAAANRAQDRQDALNVDRANRRAKVKAQRDNLRAAAALAGNKALQRKQERQWAVADKNDKYQHDLDMAKIKYEESQQTASDKAIYDSAKADAKLVRDKALAKYKAGLKPKPGSPAAKAGGDTVATPGSAKRDRAVKAARAAVMSDDPRYRGQVRNLVRYGEGAVNNKINAALRAQGVDPNSPLGKQIKASIKSEMSGRGIAGGGGGVYTAPGSKKGSYRGPGVPRKKKKK